MYINKDSYIGSYGATALIITLICTKLLISSPRLYVQHSASAGWIEVLISGVFELFVLAIVLKLLSGYDEHMDLIDIAEKSLGKVGKIIVGITSCAVFLVSTAAVFRSFGELVRNTIIKGISYEIISVCIIVSVLTAAFTEIKTQSGLSGLILPLILISVTVIFIINRSGYSFSNIAPVLGPGFKDVISNALLKNSTFFEIGIILYLIPYLGQKSTVKKIGFTALSVSLIISVLITFFYQMAVPYEAANSFAIPMYQLTRMIKAGVFFQRIEPLNIFVWGGAMLTYIGVGIWLSSNTVKKTFSLSSSRPLIFIFTLIICLLALIPGSETSVERIYDFLMTYSYIAYPVMPIVLLVICTFFQKRNKEKLI